MLPNPISKALLVTAATLSTIPLQAASWLGNNADYINPVEWSTQVLPAQTEEVIISAGLATHNGDLVRNGTTTISGSGELSVVNGRFKSGGTVEISGNAKLTVLGNYFLVGNTAVGTLNQTGGTVSATLDRGFFLSDAPAQAGSKYNLLGGTLAVINNGSGIDTNLFAVHIGKGGPGDVFTIDGGAATFTAETASRNVWLSRDSTFHLISGSAAFSGYERFTIGRFGTAGTSHLWIEGGSFEVSNLLNSFTLGDAQNGQFTLAGGTVEIANSILLGGTLGTTGSFTMSGGLLTATDILAGAGTAQFDFTGGEIILSGDRTSILDEPWFNEVPGTEASYDAETNLTHVTVPEPSSLALVAIPMAFFATRRRRCSGGQ